MTDFFKSDKPKAKMTPLKIIIILFALLGAASCGESRLSSYKCESEFDVDSCASGCNKNDGNQMSFLVEPNHGTVMIKAYDDNNEIYFSEFLSNCKIVNDKNWDCSTIEEGNYVDFQSEKKMADGIYSELLYYWERSEKKFLTNPSCAK